jgi:hypothetical protein
MLAGMVLLLRGSGAVRPAHGLSYSKLNKIQRRILSGFATSELNPAATTAAVRPRSARQARPGDVYFPTDSLGCPDRKGSNVKANRNCLNLADADLTGRSQANNETSVAIDPATGDLVMGDNDYRRGDSGCVAGYSRDGGRPGPTARCRPASPAATPSGRPASTGRGPATPPSPSTAAATPTSPACSSTGASRPPRWPTPPAPSTCTAPPATPAPPGTSPAGRWSRTRT